MKKMIKFFKDLNAVRRHSGIINIMSGVIDLLKKVAKDNKPMITHISFVNVETQEEEILVSLWAGVGEANPLLRIQHLKAQNEELKRLLKIATTDGISDSDKSHVEFVLNNFD